MDKEDLRKSSCCFTGHRPEKMKTSEKEVKILLEKEIDKAINEGYKRFITGMARGTDIWAAEIVLDKRMHNSKLQLICALPHPGFEKRRSRYDVERYNNIIINANHVTVVSDRYFSACYQKRNMYMVDNSSLVIAVRNGKPSGTKNTIDYAKAVGVRVAEIPID